MKKFLALLLSLVMVLALVACGDKKDDTNTDDQDNNEVTDFKVGFIMLHDENSTYDLNFINAAKEACETLGVEYTIVTNVPEGQECYDKAAELADAGCNIIFADSFGHEDYMIQAAKEFPNVQFCHSTGTKAHTEGLSNYHNAFASIYEGRYLAGIAAGMKLNEMIENGDITAEEARTHPNRNLITRALGPDENTLCDAFEVSFTKGDKILLCTDGLVVTATDDEICRAVCAGKSAEESLDDLIALAKAQGAPDNVTAVLIEHE